MKTSKSELSVDFIGGQSPLTQKEEQALSNYFKKKKALKIKRGRSSIKKTAIKGKKRKVTATLLKREK